MARQKFAVSKPKASEVIKLIDTIAGTLAVLPENLRGFRDFGRAIGRENLRAVRLGGKIVGGLGILNMGQFWGNRSVPCAGITILGVAAEHRGAGAAHTLMLQTLKELRKKGVPTASLYASTMKLYRKSGFEIAADRIDYELETRDIHAKERECIITRHAGKGMKLFKDFYLRSSTANNGMLDRNSVLWNGITRSRGKTLEKYVVTRAGNMEGYIFIIQDRWANPAMLTDVCFSTSAAGRAILALLRDMRSMVKTVRWSGGPRDGLIQLMDDPKFKTVRIEKLLMRIVHLPKALKARGYPGHVKADINFEIDDSIFPGNSGRWVLKVAGGRGKVKRGGSGKIRMGVRTLTQLYTGYASPRELMLTCDLKGSAGEMEKAAAVFAGTAPYCNDMF